MLFPMKGPLEPSLYVWHNDFRDIQWRMWRSRWHHRKRPLNVGQGHSFWYQSIPCTRLPIGCQYYSNFCFRTHRLATLVVGGTTGSASDQQSTNDRKVAGSRPTKVVCITVLTGNRLGWTARCGRPPLLPSCRKLEFRLSALMDSDLAWVMVRAVDKADAMLTLSSALTRFDDAVSYIGGVNVVCSSWFGIIIIIPRQCLWCCHHAWSIARVHHGSRDECSTAPGGRRRLDQADRLES